MVVEVLCVCVLAFWGKGRGGASGQVCQWDWDRSVTVALVPPQGNYFSRARVVWYWCQALWAEATRAAELAGAPYVDRDGRTVYPTTREPGIVEATRQRH